MTEHAPIPSAPDWQHALAAAIRDPAELLDLLGLDPGLAAAPGSPAYGFPLRVPRGYAARMRRGDPDDPLLRQVLPLDAENAGAPGYVADPVGDGNALQPGGVLHKYHGRALLVATGACAVNCRYCFRRHFPYTEVNASSGDWAGALDYLAATPSIREVILSGGDPLTLTDRRLAALAQGLAGLPHVRRLRIHSRLPVVLPERVDDGMLGWFAGTRLRPVMVFHANHPAELDGEVAAAAGRLRDAGVALFNQAVLLKGVNDAADTLAELSERLFDIGVQPYYLHMLDTVSGAAHFEVSDTRARALMREVAAGIPGYMLPRLVRERAGEPAKTTLSWDEALWGPAPAV